MVPRQAGLGDRAGDHGLRRRCADRVSRGHARCSILRRHHIGHRQDLPRARRCVRGVHVAGLAAGAGAAGRLEPQGWTPERRKGSMVTGGQVSAANAIKTPQFWLLWMVLCFNVTAGIGILEKASPIYQDYFPAAAAAAAALDRSGRRLRRNALAGQHAPAASAGRSLSDEIGRKNIYRIYLGVGALLYLTITLMENSNKLVFLLAHAPHPVVLRCGLRDRPGLSARPLRHLPGRRHPRPAAHRVVGRGHPRPDPRQRPRRQSAGGWARSGPALYTISFSIMTGLLARRAGVQRTHQAGRTRNGMNRARRVEPAKELAGGDPMTDSDCRHRASRLRLDGAQGLYRPRLALGEHPVRLRRLRIADQGQPSCSSDELPFTATCTCAAGPVPSCTAT